MGSSAGKVHGVLGTEEAPGQPAGKRKFLEEVLPPLSPEGPPGIREQEEEEPSRLREQHGQVTSGDGVQVEAAGEERAKGRGCQFEAFEIN